MRRRDWKTLTELADKIEADAGAGKRVVLSARTAWIVAAKLRAVDNLPSRDEIARALCTSKGYTCSDRCYACTGWANIVVGIYGCRLEPLRTANNDDSPD